LPDDETAKPSGLDRRGDIERVNDEKSIPGIELDVNRPQLVRSHIRRPFEASRELALGLGAIRSEVGILKGLELEFRGSGCVAELWEAVQIIEQKSARTVAQSLDPFFLEGHGSDAHAPPWNECKKVVSNYYASTY
jgi:hypothetical protein